MARKTVRAAVALPQPELVVPFQAYTQVYAMTVTGDCCAPDIPDGAVCAFDQMVDVEAGDYVAIWRVQDIDGRRFVRPMVKRLVLGIDPTIKLPHIMRPGDELLPIVWFETVNPSRQFRSDLRTVYGIHKCVGVMRTGGVIGGSINSALMEAPPKRASSFSQRLQVR